MRGLVAVLGPRWTSVMLIGDGREPDHRDQSPDGAGRGWVSYMRTVTISPEAAVRAATAQMAVVRPYAAARIPARRGAYGEAAVAHGR
ncbi:hypothetical protein GCM10023080_034000 [Streptomyces pseudoechinosporeus]